MAPGALSAPAVAVLRLHLQPAMPQRRAADPNLRRSKGRGRSRSQRSTLGMCTVLTYELTVVRLVAGMEHTQCSRGPILRRQDHTLRHGFSLLHPVRRQAWPDARLLTATPCPCAMQAITSIGAVSESAFGRRHTPGRHGGGAQPAITAQRAVRPWSATSWSATSGHPAGSYFSGATSSAQAGIRGHRPEI